jgi:hypothetical protein
MGGNAGALRTLRLSTFNRTLGSLLASDSGSGAGSVRRVYAYYTKNGNVDGFYKMVFDIKYGQFKDKTQWFLSNNFV